MTKVLKQLNYEERLKMFISRMQESNWIDDKQPSGGLTPFVLNDTITGVKIDCDKVDELSAYLHNFPFESGEPSGDGIQLLSVNTGDYEDFVLGINSATVFGGEGNAIFGFVGTTTLDSYVILGLEKDTTVMGQPAQKGWNKFTTDTGVVTHIDGIFDIDLESIYVGASFTVSMIEPRFTDAINGLIIGEIKG